MVVKGKTLILDNFRRCLSEYSVDIQDIVRSAILDGVDISKYLDVCRDNPFRLDQIRLGIKEGLDEALLSLNGDALYRVRKLRKSGNLAEVTRQLSKGSLSDEHIYHLLDWIQDGRSIHDIELATIPKNLLSVYDVGLSYDVDMSIFNGIKCDVNYLNALVSMAKNRRSVEKFLDSSKWDLSVIQCVSVHSANHMGWFEEWVDCITPSMSYAVVDELRELYMYMNKLSAKLRVSEETLRGIADADYLAVLVKVAKDGMDLNNFVGLDKFSADSLYMSTKQGTKKKISGNIRGKRE